MGLPFPDDSYLTLRGQAAYAVSYLEWTVLGDLTYLPGLSSTVLKFPNPHTVGDAAGRSDY